MRVLLFVLFIVGCQSERVPSSIRSRNCVLNFLELTSFYKDEKLLKVLVESDIMLRQHVGASHKTDAYMLHFIGNKVRGIFKPEMPTVDISNSKLEVLAYELDRMFNLQLVPPTTIRKVRMDGFERVEGSVQFYANGPKEFFDWKIFHRLRGPWEEIPDNLLNKEMMDRQHFFDFLIYNRDRHESNFLVRESGDIVSIDHGATFGRGGHRWAEFDRRLRAIDRFLKTERGQRALDKLRGLDQEVFNRYLLQSLEVHEAKKTLFRVESLIKREDVKILLDLENFDWYPSSIAKLMDQYKKAEDMERILILADAMEIDQQMIDLYWKEIQGQTLFLKKVREQLSIKKGGIF